jgi:hypothetical protein
MCIIVLGEYGKIFWCFFHTHLTLIRMTKGEKVLAVFKGLLL